jgi:glycosyltransferase involved in cell wall biosynthesis
MRTVAVFHLGGVGGPQRSLPQVMRWLASQGSVEFLLPEPGPTEDEYRELGPVTVLDYSALTRARGIREGGRLARRLTRETRMFRAELRRRQPDLVLVVTTVVPAALLAARLERIPVVVYAAELYEQPWKATSPIGAWGSVLAAGTALLSDGIVCCSAAVARQFPMRTRKPRAVAYPPIGSEYEDGDRAGARARLGVDQTGPCAAVVGSLSRGRGQDVSLRALPLIRQRFPEAQLLVVGAPHPRAVDRAFAGELRRLARALALEDAVVFADTAATGFGPRAMADVYAAADVVVNPARMAEAFGRVAPEALLAGKPVVASRVGAIPEVVRDGVDGLLIPPEDPPALAGAVTRLLDDPALTERLVASGRGRVRSTFGPDQDLAAWRQVLEPVLHRGGRSGSRRC